jgi:hypothetical protein
MTQRHAPTTNPLAVGLSVCAWTSSKSDKPIAQTEEVCAVSFIPPLPGEPLPSVAEVAQRAACSRQAIHDAIRNGKLTACRAAGRILISEHEAERFIREWPARKKGVAARWREFREWQAHQRADTRQRPAAQVDPEGTVS